jgi:ribosome modulation factor
VCYHTQVYVNPTQVYVNPIQMCVNPIQEQSHARQSAAAEEERAALRALVTRLETERTDAHSDADRQVGQRAADSTMGLHLWLVGWREGEKRVVAATQRELRALVTRLETERTDAHSDADRQVGQRAADSTMGLHLWLVGWREGEKRVVAATQTEQSETLGSRSNGGNARFVLHQRTRTDVQRRQSCESYVKVWHGATRKWSLNEGQIPNPTSYV